MASGFLKWAHQEISYAGEIFRSQVFETDQKFSVMAECLQHMSDNCRMVIFPYNELAFSCWIGNEFYFKSNFLVFPFLMR